ncbi:unnamed protein product, partial [Porites evermanni]
MSRYIFVFLAMILIVSEIVPVKSAGDLEDKSQTSKRNAVHVYSKQNLRKFNSKRNAKY